MNENEATRRSLDDYDEEAQRHPERYPSKVVVWIGKGIKWFFLALAALLFIVMIWRINTLERVPSEMKILSVNQATYQAYVQAAERGESLSMFTQGKIDPMTTNEEAYGYFWLADTVLLPDAQQLQLVVRYNNSTLEHLASDYHLAAVPDREETVVVIRLRVIEDATPDDPTDNAKESSWTTYTLEPTGEPRMGQKDVYNYRRYVFDGVPMHRDVIGLVVEFYYAGEADADQPLGELYAYYYEAENEIVNLTKKDQFALEEFGQK